MALIKCKALSLGYDSGAIIENLSFEVNAGDYLCILGENGSGKTTLMKALLSLKKPLSGEIIFGDGLKENEIGYLPQQTSHQRDFPASVGEIVLSGAIGRLGGRFFYGKKEKALAAECMEKLGISPLASRTYRELSGGQQQRVLLARALCATKKVLLLDEPVTGLDPIVSAEMYSVIEDLNKKEKITVIMISHDCASAMKYATHILHIGHKTFFGRKEDYISSGLAPEFTGGEGKNI